MKYVIIRKPGGAELPFLCLPPVTHRELSLMLAHAYPGCVPVAAGFVRLSTLAADRPHLETFGWSESLNLGPREADAGLLGTLYRVTLDSAAFMQPALRSQPAA